MNADTLKTACRECGQKVAFQLSDAGRSTACPACGKPLPLTLRLSGHANPPPIPIKIEHRPRRGATALLIAFLIGLAGAGTWLAESLIETALPPAPDTSTWTRLPGHPLAERTAERLVRERNPRIYTITSSEVWDYGDHLEVTLFVAGRDAHNRPAEWIERIRLDRAGASSWQ